MCHKVVLVDATSWIAQSVTLSTIRSSTNNLKMPKKLETDWIHIDFHHFPVCSHPLSSRCPFCFLVPMAQTPIWKWPNSNQQLQLRDRFSKAYSPLSSSFPRTGIRNIPGVLHCPVFHELVFGTYQVPGCRLDLCGLYCRAAFVHPSESRKLDSARNVFLSYSHIYCFIIIYILTFIYIFSPSNNGPRSWSSTRASSSIYWLMTEQRCGKYSSQ